MPSDIPKKLQGQMDALFRRKERSLLPSKHRKKIPRETIFHLGVCFLIIFFYAATLMTPVFQRFEYIFLDAFFKWRPQIQTSSSIVYIEIAEDSLDAVGRWPWPRHFHAVLAHLLSEWGARAAIFDILFSETSNKLDDGALEESIQKAGNVYLPVVLEGQFNEKKWIKSLPRLLKHARGAGHINIIPDSDGTLRRIKPFLEQGGETYPHMALRLAYDMQGQELPALKNLPFPLDDDGNLLINWAGRWKETFSHYSYSDVLKSFEAIQKGETPVISPEVFRNKICFIGLTAFGHADIKATPFEPSYPGLGVHANILNGVLTEQMLRPVPRKLNLLFLILIGILATVAFSLFNNVRVFLVGLAAAFVWVGLAFYIFVTHSIWIDVMHPIMLIFTLYIFSVAYAFILKTREAGVLFSLATRDGLTGLFVIRHFRLLLNAAVQDAKKNNKPMSVLLLDVDHFKKINDTYGHPAGDAVLREVAKIIGGVRYTLSSSKSNAETCRYGGEEFMVMLKDKSLEDSVLVGEKVRTAVEQHIFNWEGLRIPVTISIGCSTLHNDENIPDLMVRRADIALYEAKRGGRNRTVPESAFPVPEK